MDDMAIIDYGHRPRNCRSRQACGSAAGPTAASPLLIIAQTTRFKAAISGAGEANNTSSRSRPIPARLHHLSRHSVGESCPSGTNSPRSTSHQHHHATLFMGGNIDWTSPSSRRAMYQAMKHLGCETQLVVYPGEYHDSKPPAISKTRSSVTSRGTRTT